MFEAHKAEGEPEPSSWHWFSADCEIGTEDWIVKRLVRSHGAFWKRRETEGLILTQEWVLKVRVQDNVSMALAQI